MLTRDHYIAILEKRASDEASSAAEIANKEVVDNTKDNRTYLGGLFDNTSSVEKHQTKQVGKLFSGKGVEQEPGGQFLKVARVIFDDAMLSAHKEGLMKTASPAYREVAFHSFCQELEKIGGVNTTAMHSAFQRVNGGLAAKVTHIADPLEAASGRNMHALAPAVQAMRAKASQPGIMGRVGSAVGRLFGK